MLVKNFFFFTVFCRYFNLPHQCWVLVRRKVFPWCQKTFHYESSFWKPNSIPSSAKTLATDPKRGKLLPESKICSREEGMKFARGKRIGKRSRDNSKTVMNNQQSSKNSGYFYKNICGNEEGEHQCHEVVKRQNAKWDSSINSFMTGGRYHIETSPSIDWFLYDNGLRH